MGGPHAPIFFLSFFMGLQNGEHGQKDPYGVYKIEGHPTFVQLSHSGWDQLDSQGPGGPM